MLMLRKGSSPRANSGDFFKPLFRTRVRVRDSMCLRGFTTARRRTVVV